mmetsp:Transcript_58846/g.108688  ORF Transcript_58846/g.108688 Transcript_58846/m.108688 type:complete len:137 (+) Transcript_58846:100-510(+)
MLDGTGPVVSGTVTEAMEPIGRDGGGILPIGMDAGGIVMEPGRGGIVVGGMVAGGRMLPGGGMLPSGMLGGGIMPGPMLGAGPGDRGGDMFRGGGIMEGPPPPGIGIGGPPWLLPPAIGRYEGTFNRRSSSCRASM